MPRVVIVTQNFPPDKLGNASRIHDNGKQLVETGWDVTVLCPPASFPFGQFDRSWTRTETQSVDGITVRRLWTWQPETEDPGFLSRLAYYLFFAVHAMVWLLFARRKFDVIVTSSPPVFTGIAGLPFALASRPPVVADVRDLWIDAAVSLDFIRENGVFERLSRRYERLFLQSVDQITVTTSVLESRLTALYGIDPERVHHIPNGVNTSRFTPSETPDGPAIVYTGNVGYAQDLESCVRAMTQLESTDAVLKIVGDGDRRAALEELVERKDLEDRVEFTGLLPRDRIPKLLDDAMIGVAPLKSTDALEYAVPTKAYEYMACALPVIATGTGEIESLLDRSGGGVVVDNDPAAIATEIDRLLSDDGEREAMGERGREHVVRRYDRGAITRRLSDVFATACGTAPSAGDRPKRPFEHRS
ncbi:glycosyltransferase family 4 protein [Halosolutus amylolyticus]|uniref:Glycosyltransferase family 4 protein n=1 Tax=Halosolutus amylolyticus TaxID=2932267 RepID=A0ABD5PNQ6_9EURY|nr:glycosyltransferase family 4 protein [Halosolutus amylolyticus]